MKRRVILLVTACLAMAFFSRPATAEPGGPGNLGGGGTPLALGGKHSQARCPCPCKVQCAPELVCDCTGLPPAGPGTRVKCHCSQSEITVASASVLLDTETPVLEMTWSNWFEVVPPESFRAAFGAVSRDSGERISFLVTYRIQNRSPLAYAPAEDFDPAAFRDWRERADPRRPITFHAVHVLNPATFAIREGDLRHLSEAMVLTVSLVGKNGERARILRTGSTLAWETDLYLRSMIGCLPAEAFRQGVPPDETRSILYGSIETAGLLIKASDFEGARKSLQRTIARLSDEWLDPNFPLSGPTICSFRSGLHLLAPGSDLPCNP